MSLDYKILWIDDTPDWVDSIKDPIEDLMRDLSLTPIITVQENGTDIEKLIIREGVDLLIIDYNLPGRNGDELIKAVREYGQLTEIVFYSQDDSHMGAETLDEGIHCILREDAQERINEVIQQFASRLDHIGLMRGMIITEAIDVENQLTKIIKILFEDKADLLQSKILNARHLDFSAKYQFVQSYLKDLIADLKNINPADPAINKLEEIKETNKSLRNEIIHQRNILAHSEKIFNTDGFLELEGLNKKVPNIVFNSDWKNTIRQNIRKHRSNLQHFIDFLTE